MGFQSTLPHGERPAYYPPARAATSNFNPRSRMGSDCLNNRYTQIHVISIHAPAWGATRSSAPSTRTAPWNFNPRSRMGSDQVHGATSGVNTVFQSTLPHGERPPALSTTASSERISIHAPAWGATYISPASLNLTRFQSTLPHGERPAFTAINSRNNKFQSTLPHGERRRLFDRRFDMNIFQSTLPHGERLQQRTAYSAMWTISSVTANNVLLR